MFGLACAVYIFAKGQPDGSAENKAYALPAETIPAELHYVGDGVVIAVFTSNNLGALTAECFQSADGLVATSVAHKGPYLEITFDSEVLTLRQTCEAVPAFELALPYRLNWKSWEQRADAFYDIMASYRRGKNIPVPYYSAKLSQIARTKLWEHAVQQWSGNNSQIYGEVGNLMRRFRYYPDDSPHFDSSALMTSPSTSYVMAPKMMFDMLVSFDCYIGPFQDALTKSVGIAHLFVNGRYYVQFVLSDQVFKDSTFAYYGKAQATPDPNPDPGSDSNKKLPPGAAAGIVIAVLAVVIVGVTVAYQLQQRHKNAAQQVVGYNCTAEIGQIQLADNAAEQNTTEEIACAVV